MMNFQQIGRNYYNPKDPVSIPNHRFVKMDTRERENDFSVLLQLFILQ